MTAELELSDDAFKVVFGGGRGGGRPGLFVDPEPLVLDLSAHGGWRARLVRRGELLAAAPRVEVSDMEYVEFYAVEVPDNVPRHLRTPLGRIARRFERSQLEQWRANQLGSTDFAIGIGREESLDAAGNSKLFAWLDRHPAR